MQTITSIDAGYSSFCAGYTLMHIIKIAIVTLLTSCIICLAEDRTGSQSTTGHQSNAAERSTETYDPAVITAATKASTSTTTATANSEVYGSINIAAGKSVYIDSTLDYTSANTVAITVQCTGCTSAATSLGTSGLVLHASWLVPNAEWYGATENMPATGFLYWDVGGAIFNVYGSQFRLILQNTGSSTIALKQITLFSRN